MENLIAASMDFKIQDGVFRFKIAYDEKYSKFSPGLILEETYLKQLYTMDEIKWGDSCADADSPTLNRFWTKRKDARLSCIRSS